MRITFLGTGSMVPTRERNHSAALLNYRNENILIDCGEGTQRQFRVAGLSPAKITRILITHWHGDHVLGLAGLLTNMDKLGHVASVEIYGPKGSRNYLGHMMAGISHNLQMRINLIEIDKKVFLETDDFYMEALSLGHSPECLGYSFVEKDRWKINMDYLKKVGVRAGPELRKLQEGKSITANNRKIEPKKAARLVKGRKICIITDTGYCKNILKLAKDSDLLISEATFSSELFEKAEKYRHLDAGQVGKIAKKANAKKLIITHFSQRYKDAAKLLNEVKKDFKNAYAAEDFMAVDI